MLNQYIDGKAETYHKKWQYALPLFLACAVAFAQEPESEDEDELPPEVIIVGGVNDAQDIPGSAHFIGPEELQRFNYSDIHDIVREVPGISVQMEDGYGLRPNISIRGTPTERSASITLLEDGVMIAPAPYSAPSAYYFPTAGRMHAIEVLKGPSAITQGPYTIGGTLNMISTPIPRDTGSRIMMEKGGDSEYRLHAYGGGTSDSGVGMMIETHQWGTDGFQNLDTGGDTGLSLQDYTFKLRYAPTNSRHSVDLKFQVADQSSDQSYLGLTDKDFGIDPHRRYGVSQLDNIKTQHDQQILTYRYQASDSMSFSATLYNNEHQRNWFKTEGMKPAGNHDGSDNWGSSGGRSSWSSIIGKINKGDEVCGGGVCYTAEQAQEILRGERDTNPGAIQLKTNAREYFSRGVQFRLNWGVEMGAVSHDIEIGVRFHEDEEDRIQRNDAYTQVDGQLILFDEGTMGHSGAGNRLQEAEAVAIHIYDRIEWGDWVFTPGVRYEDIDQKRTRWRAHAERPGEAGVARGVFRSTRQNKTDVLLPGMGAMYQVNDNWSVLAGVHEGFSAPSNSPGVDEEEATNYEFGFRYANSNVRGEVIGFYHDYENFLGECTASSGADCEVGDAFNGDAATVEGIEVLLAADLAVSETMTLPLSLAYTYMDTEFDTDFDSEFFGGVTKGDPIPYIPDNQLRVGLGLETSNWSINLSGNYVDDVCVAAACGAFQKTDSSFTVDLGASYRIGSHVTLIARVSNLFDEEDMVARQPYGARPNKARTGLVGIRVENFF